MDLALWLLPSHWHAISPSEKTQDIFDDALAAEIAANTSQNADSIQQFANEFADSMARISPQKPTTKTPSDAELASMSTNASEDSASETPTVIPAQVPPKGARAAADGTRNADGGGAPPPHAGGVENLRGGPLVDADADGGAANAASLADEDGEASEDEELRISN